MAATRPVVLVFQEFATLSSSPTIPELNCLIAGPSYWIQDFPEDRATIKLGLPNVPDYGIVVTAPVDGGLVVTTAKVVADAPNNKIGAVLDQASVRIFTSKTLVEIAVGTDLASALLSPVVSSALVNFTTAGIQPNDTIVITNLAGTVTVTRTVRTVDSATTLTLNSDSTFASTGPGTSKFSIRRALPETEISSGQYTFIPATNSIQLNALATIPVNTVSKRIVSCELYVAYRSLRQDLQDVTTISGTSEVLGQLGRIDSRNPLAAGVFVALQNTNTVIQYFGIKTNDIVGFTTMLESIGTRKDIYAVVPLCSGDLATNVLAGMKAEFTALADPLLAGVNGIPQKFRVAIGSSAALPPTKTVIDVNADGATQITAGTTPTDVHTIYVTSGGMGVVLPGDTLIISVDAQLPTRVGTYTVVEALSDTFSVVVSGNVPGGAAVPALASVTVKVGVTAVDRVALASTVVENILDAHTFNIVGVDLILANVQPGDSIVVTGDAATVSRNGTYVVSQVLSATSVEVDTNVIKKGAIAGAAATVAINVGATVTPRIAATPVTLATTASVGVYLDLYDANGTFIDDAVQSTDLVEMPQNPGQTSFTTKHSFVVANIVSNQRLRIVNNGRSNSLLANELPHGASRNSPVTTISTLGALNYRITRTLDKTGQVSELISVPQSIASRRVVNVWPDLCDVSGLVDGSLPRATLTPTTPQPAATQPGYYLACAVGGMTAGLASHQGFTNLGIAGISKLYNANTYFSDTQITNLSNGGWFVFQQDTPQSLPYCIHQLTTDVSTLQSGEFSMVKNFDFVSIFFAAILDDYLGFWNINQETIGFISAALTNGIESLRLRRLPRIGAPIIDAKIVSLAVSPSSADRLEIYVEAQFPAPLNVIALHLVSV